MQRHDEPHVVPAEGEELGPDGRRSQALREVAEDSEVHRVLSAAYRVHEDHADEIGYVDWMVGHRIG